MCICADWSRRGQCAYLPVEITCPPVQPCVDCALELALCNAAAACCCFSLWPLQLFLLGDSLSGLGVAELCMCGNTSELCWLSFLAAIVSQLLNGVFCRLEHIVADDYSVCGAEA